MGFRPPIGSPLLLFLLIFLVVPPAAADILLVVPFENGAEAGELEWVGESFTEALNERLAGFGYLLVTREERLDGLERLGLPAVPALTRASLLRLGEEVGARWIVVGRFRVADERLETEAQVLDVERLTLSPPLRESGPFARLLDIQTHLAWKILRHLDPAFPLSREVFAHRFPRREVSAFESYVRGLRAFNRDQQMRYFLQAARSQPDFPPPAYRLGMLYFEDQNYDAAAEWFRNVLDDPRLGWDARFYLSLCHFFSKDLDAAAEALAPVAEHLSARQVWNNLGVYASRQGREEAADYFQRALEEDPDDPDVYFNLGLHHLRQSRWSEAEQALERCLAFHAGDTEAQFLRAKALRQLGRPREAERARQEAIGDNPALAASLERRGLDLDRLQESFSAHAVLLQRRREETPEGEASRRRHVAIHIRRGEDLLARDELEFARQEFTQAILLNPDAHRAHSLLAEVYYRQGRLQDAVSELRASLWSRETVPARLRLAQIYLKLNRVADARRQVEAALALDPQNPAALALRTQLLNPGSEAGSERANPQ